jgi:hypothetical protein
MTHPVPTPIYHLTHIDNLQAILASARLLCKGSLTGKTHVDVSHYDLQERRRRRTVTCDPGGNLHDYVPFYFAPRSPMLYALYRGNVAGYGAGQTPLVYLVSSVQRVASNGLPFVFTDGHPIMALSQFYTEVGALNRIAWDVMAGTYWNDTPEFPNRKQLRQAEFLVHQTFPWEAVEFVGVRSPAIKTQVERLLDTSPERPLKPVQVMPSWYF